MSKNNQFCKPAKKQSAPVLPANGISQNPVLISNREFQAIFGISAETSRAWRKRYQIPFVIIGHNLYFRWSTIEELLQEKTITLKRYR